MSFNQTEYEKGLLIRLEARLVEITNEKSKLEHDIDTLKEQTKDRENDKRNTND